jgi:hypothetical protein
VDRSICGSSHSGGGGRGGDVVDKALAGLVQVQVEVPRLSVLHIAEELEHVLVVLRQAQELVVRLVPPRGEASRGHGDFVAPRQ